MILFYISDIFNFLKIKQRSFDHFKFDVTIYPETRYNYPNIESSFEDKVLGKVAWINYYNRLLKVRLYSSF